MPYLTVPIAASDFERARKQIISAIVAGAQMLELRTDYLENLNIELMRRLIAEAKNIPDKPMPLIVTCRDKRQGGCIDYPPELRLEILIRAAMAGVEFIDIEYENFLQPENQKAIKAALAENAKTKLIISAHNFETKFENIETLYNDIKESHPAAIPKLVYTASHINDCFDGFDLLHKTNGERIIFSMGQAGLISRILAKKLGSLVTFASINQQAATAPGQITIDEFKKLYRYGSINGKTQLYGVIADPVAHSMSPAIHNACFADAKVNGLYLPLLVAGGRERFYEFMDNVLAREWLGFKGFSVTIPHKENALNYTLKNKGTVEPLAERIKAVNTLVVHPDGRLSAYNTDYSAALDSITDTLKKDRDYFKDLFVALIGAGGVARAIVAGLSDAGANITIYNRTVERAEKLAAEFKCSFAGLDKLAELDAKLIINCTSIGMYPDIDASPLKEGSLKRGQIVFDTVYNPAETLLLKQAKQAGAKMIDGVSMFVNQAAAQFKLFTGKDANTELMRKTIVGNLID